MRQGENMIDILNRHLAGTTAACTTGLWINTLDKKTQDAFTAIKENSKTVVIAKLYAELNNESQLPFKLTAFRSHLRGYCACQTH